MESQAALEADLIGVDIRQLTSTIRWMTEQGLSFEAIEEATTKLVALTRERDRFVGQMMKGG